MPKLKQGAFTSTSENLGPGLKVLGKIFQHKYVTILSCMSPPDPWDESSCKKGTCMLQELGSLAWAGGPARQQAVDSGSSPSITRHCRSHRQSICWTPQPPQRTTSSWGTARPQCRNPCLVWKQMQTWSGSILPSFFQGRLWKGRFSHHYPSNTFLTL